MRASRLLQILILLQMRGRLSADALAREFEVSVRTIYRDIDHLSAAGVPVYAERGRTGGFALHEGYRTRLTGFTAAEADAILLAGASSAASDLGLGPELATAQLKLLASLPPESGASAQRVAAQFHLDHVAWYSPAAAPNILPLLAAAVWRETRIRVRYESWKELVTRELEPLGLVLKAGLWYLVAGAGRGEPRTYRVSNIKELEVLGATFKRPQHFDLARHWDAWVKDFESRQINATAVVKLSPAGLKLLRDVSPASAQAVDTAHKATSPKGWVKAEIPVESIDYSARHLLRLGAEIEVLKPPELRAAIAREARKVAELYAKRERT